jgi:hypothetical protein
MFYEMCGLEMTGTKAERTLELCSVKPLADGDAFEVVDDKEVWHPNWAGNLNDRINKQFVQAVVDRLWQNEDVSTAFVALIECVLTSHDSQRLRALNDGKGEITANDFSKTIMMSCVKIYFQNVHKQYTRRFNEPDKYEGTLIAGRHRGRRQGVSN